MTATDARDERAAELKRAISILAGMTGDAEARRDTAFSCMAELLRIGRADLAHAMSAELLSCLPDDPETAFVPPDPPPELSPNTHWAFDVESCGEVWPWGGTEVARARLADPCDCAGLGAQRFREGHDGWQWAETGAANAVEFRVAREHAPRCEPLGTLLAWLVAGKGRLLPAWSIPPELRDVWPFTYPEARHFVRPDAEAAAATGRLAADMKAEGEKRAREHRERVGSLLAGQTTKPTGDAD